MEGLFSQVRATGPPSWIDVGIFFEGVAGCITFLFNICLLFARGLGLGFLLVLVTRVIVPKSSAMISEHYMTLGLKLNFSWVPLMAN